MSEPTSESVAGTGTGAGLIAFLDHAIEKSELPGASGVALRVGARRVLETDESLFEADMRKLDVDDVIRRFHNKHRGGKLSDGSREDYARRFRQSLEMYTKWLADDPSWRPAARKATPRAKATSGNGGQAKAARPTATVPAQTSAVDEAGAEHTRSPVEMVRYPFLVRPGVRVHVELPADLTAKEAERVAKFVASLAFDERLAITAGPEAE